MNDELVHAIGGKHLVEFVYKAGRARIVEPHDYGIRRDVERLLGFQIGGESQSGIFTSFLTSRATSWLTQNVLLFKPSLRASLP